MESVNIVAKTNKRVVESKLMEIDQLLEAGLGSRLTYARNGEERILIGYMKWRRLNVVVWLKM